MDMLRRTAARTKAQITGHDHLTVLISEQKTQVAAMTSMINAQAKHTTFLMRWAQNEQNPAIRDVLGKLRDIHRAERELERFIANRQVELRAAFKDLLKREREVDAVRKIHAAAQAKVARLVKQKEAAGKNASKLATVQLELDEAEASEKQAEIEFASCFHDLETAKCKKVKEAFSKLAQVQADVAEKSQILARAKVSLMALIPDEPPHVTGSNSYAFGPEKSDMIVCESIRRAELEYLFAEDDEPIVESSTTKRNLARSNTVSLPKTAIKAARQQPRDAMDILGMDGEVISEDRCVTRPLLDGVPAPGAPLVGSRSLWKVARQHVMGGDSRFLDPHAPLPPPRRPLSDAYEEPGYVVPNNRRSRMFEEPIYAEPKFRDRGGGDESEHEGAVVLNLDDDDDDAEDIDTDGPLYVSLIDDEPDETATDEPEAPPAAATPLASRGSTPEDEPADRRAPVPRPRPRARLPSAPTPETEATATPEHRDPPKPVPRARTLSTKDRPTPPDPARRPNPPRKQLHPRTSVVGEDRPIQQRQRVWRFQNGSAESGVHEG